jgi:tetrahydromethanopterin S-methyltransferase subunit B
MFIDILPEFGLVADPLVGIVTTAGESFAPIIEKVQVLESISDDLINMLSGEGNFLASFPNRDKALPIGGSIVPFWYGMAVGLLIAGIIVFHLV